MTPEVIEIPVVVTARLAAYHWQARLRIVLHVGPDRFFLLLSYDDGSAVIHEAIDESGTVGGDWWGQAHASSLEESLQEFAQTNGLAIDSLRAAISAVEIGDVNRKAAVAAPRTKSAAAG
jgi:hypothetical protein